MQVEIPDDMPVSSVPEQKRWRGWRVFTYLLIFLLLSGGVALFLSRQARPTTSTFPTTLRWQRVLQQPFLSALASAPDDPAFLYSYILSAGFLRSTDAGIQWQPFHTPLVNVLDCSIAVNPVQARDLYISSVSQTSVYSLIHSRDGGQTWTTIQATLTLPDGRSLAWAGSGLSFFGTRLFAVQDIQQAWHLISSVDGGHVWTVIDANIVKDQQKVTSYAVDPGNPRVVYELVGTVLVGSFVYAPSGATPSPVPSPVPAAQLVGRLYKSSDGGSSWHELLAGVPYGSVVRLALKRPDLLYIGGLSAGKSAASAGLLHMQRSTDGGLSWQAVVPPANMPLLANWHIDASGLLYITVSQTASQSASSIQRYDPAANQWSGLALPSRGSVLLAVTPAASSSGGDVFWATDLMALYRGTLSLTAPGA